MTLTPEIEPGQSSRPLQNEIQDLAKNQEHTNVPAPYGTETVMLQLRPLLDLVIDDVNELSPGNTEFDKFSRKRFLADEVGANTPKIKLISILTSMYEQSVEEVSVEDFAKKYEAQYGLDPSLDLADAVDYRLTGQALFSARSRDIVGALEFIIEQDPSNAYHVAKILSAPAREIVDDRNSVILQDFCIMGAEFESTDLYGQLVEQIEKGEFDSYVAKDVLQLSLNTDSSAIPARQSDEINKMIVLAAKVSNSSAEEIIGALSQPEVVDVWPLEARKYFSKYREDLISSLRHRFTVRKRFLHTAGYMHATSQPKHLEILIKNSSELTIGGLDKPLSKMDEVIRNVEQRKRKRPGQQVGKLATAQAQLSTAEAIKQPERVVGAIEKNGEIHGEDSEYFQEMISEFCGEHPGCGLEEVAKNAISYLKEPVKAYGNDVGIKVLADTKIILGDKGLKYKVYRLRPDQAPGVATGSIASKMRILFVLDKDNSNQLHILGIADKDKIHPLYRRFGIKSVGTR